jgi:Txe/YoeB family toxin of Txe-Axe toxin-antitoxin module
MLPAEALFEEFRAAIELAHRFQCSSRDNRSKCGRPHKALLAHREPSRLGHPIEALAGDRKGQYSIRINDQWRLSFEWSDGAPGPSNVEIVDYR